MSRSLKRNNKSSIGLIKEEFLKNMRIIFRGPSRTLLLLCLIFPFTYLFFMNLVFGAVNFNYPFAVVIPDYTSNDELNSALDNNGLPNTQEFLGYLNNNDLVGETVVKSHIKAIGTTLKEFEDELYNEELVMVVILPVNFEHIIKAVKNGIWSGGEIKIELKCLNINEDYLKNLYFGFQRKLKAYYDNVLSNEIEVIYFYQNADMDRVTFPRMWTIGTGALGFVALTASMIIGAAFVFNEKNNKMSQELALASPRNLTYTYLGKIFATTIIAFFINFTLGAFVIFIWIGIPFPIDFIGFLLIILGTILLGAIIGSMLGALIPEQVFTFPGSMFLVLTTLFLCGGFMDIELSSQPLRSIIEWIPFTYCYSIIKSTVLTGGIPSITHIIGLICYIFIFFILGLKIYRKFIISDNFIKGY
ncbi:MAG: ABC transporter permease [Promethearchaeota archaeon]